MKKEIRFSALDKIANDGKSRVEVIEEEQKVIVVEESLSIDSMTTEQITASLKTASCKSKAKSGKPRTNIRLSQKSELAIARASKSTGLAEQTMIEELFILGEEVKHQARNNNELRDMLSKLGIII